MQRQCIFGCMRVQEVLVWWQREDEPSHNTELVDVEYLFFPGIEETGVGVYLTGEELQKNKILISLIHERKK